MHRFIVASALVAVTACAMAQGSTTTCRDAGWSVRCETTPNEPPPAAFDWGAKLREAEDRRLLQRRRELEIAKLEREAQAASAPPQIAFFRKPATGKLCAVTRFEGRTVELCEE